MGADAWRLAGSVRYNYYHYFVNNYVDFDDTTGIDINDNNFCPGPGHVAGTQRCSIVGDHSGE